ncbi:PIN domain-containing protein [Sphingomonas sp. CFBP 8760]|uniref:PIN domain-containing protein n=1 Tax=Sphingomonas sp. CFBP 8760 TaxID=2775282 RepID=UPI0018FE13F8|nr:PIN domain-containing protein [Sphingomonas sp. CFBP 8760]
MYLIDTNIAIYLRDVEATITERVERLAVTPAISILSWVELEAGVHRDPGNAVKRRANLDSLLQLLPMLDLSADTVTTYGRIVATCGFSRSKIIDRLIAATALVGDLTLITVNAADFRDIPGLRLEPWPAPVQ